MEHEEGKSQYTSHLDTSMTSQPSKKPRARGRPEKYPALYDLISRTSALKGKSTIDDVQFKRDEDGKIIARIDDQVAPVYINRGLTDNDSPLSDVSISGIVHGPKKQSQYSREKASAEQRGVLDEFLSRNKERSARSRAQVTQEEKDRQLQSRRARMKADLQALALVDQELAERKKMNKLEKARAYNRAHYASHPEKERARRMQRYYRKKAAAILEQGAASSSKIVHDFDLNELAPLEEEEEGMLLTRRAFLEESLSVAGEAESSVYHDQSTSVETSSDHHEPEKKMSRYMKVIKRYEREGTLEKFKMSKKAIQEDYRRRAIERERLLQEREGGRNHLPDNYRARKFIEKAGEGTSQSVKVPEVTYHQNRLRILKEKGTLEAHKEMRREASRRDRLKALQKSMQKPSEGLSITDDIPILESSVAQSSDKRPVRDFDLNVAAMMEEEQDMPLTRRTLNEASSSRMSGTESSDLMEMSTESGSQKELSKYMKRIKKYEQEGRLNQYKQKTKRLQDDHIRKAIEKETLLQRLDKAQGHAINDFQGRKYVTVGEGDEAYSVPQVTYHQARIRSMREKGTLEAYREKRKKWSRDARLKAKGKALSENLAAANQPVEAPETQQLHIFDSAAPMDVSLAETNTRSHRSFDLNLPASEEEASM